MLFHLSCAKKNLLIILGLLLVLSASVLKNSIVYDGLGIPRCMVAYGRETPAFLAVAIVVVLLMGTFTLFNFPTNPISSTRTVTTGFSIKGTGNVTVLSIALLNTTLGSRLELNVTFRNTGDLLADYVTGGGGSSVRFTVTPVGAVQEVSISTPLCGIPPFTVAVEPGQVAHALSGSCADTGFYKFAQKGEVTINVYLDWEEARTELTLRTTSAVINFTIT